MFASLFAKPPQRITLADGSRAATARWYRRDLGIGGSIGPEHDGYVT
jgi:hypothetical protein